MTTSDARENQLGRVIEALDSARRRPARFGAAAEVPIVLAELEQWLDDERQWMGGYSGQWTSLLGDLVSARKAVGPTLETVLRSGDRAESWSEIDRVRRTLKDHRRGGPDPVLRRRLSQAAKGLREAVRDPSSLLAAWQDLAVAENDEIALVRAYTLLALATEQGIDAGGTARALVETLRDSAHQIAILRGESPNRFETLGERADTSVDERLELCRQVLAVPAESAEVVVWLRYLLAPLEDGQIIDLSDRVAIYAQHSLGQALKADDQERLPLELQDGNRPHSLATMARLPDDDDAGAGEREEEDHNDERPPHALIRIDLGRVRVAEALALARETAELLVSLAVLHGADPAIWLLTDDHAMFRNGQPSGANFSAPPVFKPTLEQQSAMVSDRLPYVLAEWTDQLAPHLPLTGHELRRAAQLAYWMRRAREAWEPGRIVLYDRVFEQVAGWAGFTDLGRFIEDCLRPSWSLGRVRNEITGCWSALHSAGNGPLRQISEEAWTEISAMQELEYVPRDDGGWEANLRGVLICLESILGHLPNDSALHERVRQLHARTSSPGATLGWLGSLDKDFVALRGRSRRLRNALVHGGPVSEGAARSVLPFVEWLATDALHTALDGLLGNETDLIDHFLARRADQLGVTQRLRSGEQPEDVLFWGESP